MTLYSEEEMLQLSGIQHFKLCPRQWALIHLEQAWSDNALTMEGSLLHENVDDPFRRETNGSPVITLRGFRLSSSLLGLSGIADAIELHPFENAPKGKKELFESRQYSILPIEYKRGKSKINDCDRIQVTAQAMILEEMLNVQIPTGAIFYWSERHREIFQITHELRSEVVRLAKEMHCIMSSHKLPVAEKKSGCRSCSLYDLCLPKISARSATKYINESIQSI